MKDYLSPCGVPPNTGPSAARPCWPADRPTGAWLPWVSKSREVNEYHKLCGSDEWRTVVRDSMLPWALGDLDLGDDEFDVPSFLR